MNKQFKIKFIGLLSVFTLGIFTSCETTDLEHKDNPNALSPSSADIDFFLTSVQTDLAYFFEGVSPAGSELTRNTHMFGPLYDNAYAPSAFNAVWSRGYAGVLPDVRNYSPIAEEQGLYTHIAIGQIAEAYVMATYVDYFGDVPYTESNDPNFVDPKADSGASIYEKLHTLLDSAIENLNKDESRLPSNDIYYDGDEDKWIALANTLKIKLYLQTRLVTPEASKAGINAIITSGDFISTSAGDFQFQWSTTDTDPDSRHPWFSGNFENGGGISNYMSNHFMNELREGKGVEDPRLRYYIYRQNDESAQNTVEQACYGTLPPTHYGFSIPYCSLDDGYWGRDHGDDGGIPPDTGLRATFGVYPVGGMFDDNSYTSITTRKWGLNGAGISPIMLSSYTHFMLAEAALELGTTGSAKDYLMAGVDQSITKVMAFGASVADDGLKPDAADITAYTDAIAASYDAAASDDDKMNVIAKEYFVALFGNGVEAFNTYRRTGKPDNLQPLRKDDTNKYLRSFYYPTSYINNNSNATQKANVEGKVFWDTNPDTDFIN